MASCVIDTTVLNSTTLSLLNDIGLSFFAGLCGRNRGVFVTNPTDYGTWGCTAMPPELAVLANISDPTIIVKDANAIKELYVAGNITSDDTIKLLNYFVQSVYSSTSNTKHDTYACELGGLTTLIDCPTISATKATAASTTTTLPPKVRSVTMLGVFIPSSIVGTDNVPWEDRKAWYTVDDFQQIEALGLNTIQIPIPVSSFSSSNENHPHVTYLTSILQNIGNLKVLLMLEFDPSEKSLSSNTTTATSITAAIEYVKLHSDKFVGIQIPSKHYISVARSVAGSAFNIFVPVNEGDLPTLVLDPNNPTTTFGSLTLDHSSTVQDIASSTSLDDRRKLFYQESKACIYRSPLEYSACYHNVPVYISNGFDLSIDNCIHLNETSSFVDYGQCDRFNETIDSPWWYQHRQSFLQRQLFSYEKGLGWSYTSWKLYNKDNDDDVVGTLDTPATLIALQNVVAAKLVPSSFGEDDDVSLACLNPPANDFIMGDATYSPTPGPPPDCGYGWWNTTINDCTYWIPPPVAPPTPNPTPEPLIIIQQQLPTVQDYIYSGTIGAIIMFIVGSLLLVIYNKCCNNRRTNDGYTTIQ